MASGTHSGWTVSRSSNARHAVQWRVGGLDVGRLPAGVQAVASSARWGRVVAVVRTGTSSNPHERMSRSIVENVGSVALASMRVMVDAATPASFARARYDLREVRLAFETSVAASMQCEHICTHLLRWAELGGPPLSTRGIKPIP